MLVSSATASSLRSSTVTGPASSATLTLPAGRFFLRRRKLTLDPRFFCKKRKRSKQIRSLYLGSRISTVSFNRNAVSVDFTSVYVPFVERIDTQSAMVLELSRNRLPFPFFFSLSLTTMRPLHLVRFLPGASARTMFDEVVAVLAVGVAGTESLWFAAFMLEHAPTGVVKLLWVNLVKDKIGALALITRPPNDEYMEQALVGREGNHISNAM
ncbi:hypothetical protein B296_00003020 [Ensete ventricosum]|uniref:Uncharacterized protein n=1 Tax=Ensete ventricosum TaxID=4639 RepID=A0A426XVH8_ENSVE|nr:hypothetical protein B296_00003020 [Ensete ventricosum]